jgi:hypothetical protein
VEFISVHEFRSNRSALLAVLAQIEIREASCPPESGGQRDRDVVEIVRGVVPKPHLHRGRLGTTPRGIRFAIPLPSSTQEGSFGTLLQSDLRDASDRRRQ